MKRCSWVTEDEMYIDYHDNEWGVPVHDDRKLFEFLILEGAQAGLSWITILRKREAYREAFDGFDFEKVALYGEEDVERLIGNSGIVRNKLKIKSAVKNARVFLEIRKEFGSFDKYIWGFVNGETVVNNFRTLEEVPTFTELSEKISGDLKKRGMKFVGPVIIYAFMQAVGMVDDHVVGCWKRK